MAVVLDYQQRPKIVKNSLKKKNSKIVHFVLLSFFIFFYDHPNDDCRLHYRSVGVGVDVVVVFACALLF